MAEKILKTSFNEITTIQVICKDCKTGVNLSIDRLATAPLTCPGCNKALRRPDVDKAMKDLSSALLALRSHNDVEVQLDLKMPE